MSVGGGTTACDPGSALRQYDKNDKTGQTIVSYSIVRRKVTLEKKKYSGIKPFFDVTY
jgi:hypothetical protein